MAHSITIDGVDLGGAEHGFTVEANDFVNPPEARVNRDAFAMADGEAAQGATFGARTGTVSGVVQASSYANLLIQRENINRACFKTQEGSKVLTFDAQPGKQWRGRVLKASWGEGTTVTAELALTLYAPQPWAEASAAAEVAGVSIPSSPTTI